MDNYYNNLNKVIVSEAFLEKFFEMGGKLPKGMSLTNESDKVYVEPLDEDELHLRDFLKYGLSEFKYISRVYNVSGENIRMVFAFDC